MRIGVFGNINNYPLLLVLALRRLGHNAVLVVNRKERLHRPEAKYPEFAQGYPHWILDCSDIPEEEFVAATPRIDPVLDFLGSGSRGLVLNDLGPSLLGFIPMPAVAMMTGSDLTYYAEPGTTAVRQTGWDPQFAGSIAGRRSSRRWDEFIARQREGIRNATMVSAPFPGLVPQIDTLLQDIGVDDARRDYFYLAEVGNPPSAPEKNNPRLRIVNGARLTWKKPLPAGFSSQDHKGTDVLLEGFAAFVRSGGDADLVMFRKGLHVAETEQVADALGISSRITWLDEMGLKEFYGVIADADIVCDQFGDSFPGMVAMDAMAMGLPLVADIKPEVMAPRFPEPIPAFHARTPREIATHFHALAESPRVRVDAGRAARVFARRHLSPAAAAKRCERYLAA
jgi:glycosyltransferase involved in cell wall biosynthesis